MSNSDASAGEDSGRVGGEVGASAIDGTDGGGEGGTVVGDGGDSVVGVRLESSAGGSTGAGESGKRSIEGLVKKRGVAEGRK